MCVCVYVCVAYGRVVGSRLRFFFFADIYGVNFFRAQRALADSRGGVKPALLRPLYIIPPNAIRDLSKLHNLLWNDDEPYDTASRIERIRKTFVIQMIYLMFI